MNISFSVCETFLEVDEMKFMAVESATCDGCHFKQLASTRQSSCKFFDLNKLPRCHSTSRTNDRLNIIWMRML